VDDFKQPAQPTPPVQPSEPDPMPSSSGPMVVKKPSSAKKWLLWGVVVLLLAGLSAFSYWQWTEAENAKKEAESAKQELATAKAADAAEKDQDDTPTTSNATTSDKEQITAVLTAKAHATTVSEKTKFTVKIFKQNETFAYAGVSVAASEDPNGGGGYASILKKVDGQWVIIFQGQDTPDETTIKQYSIPSEYQSS